MRRVLLCCLLVAGCAWQRIPVSPSYQSAVGIPMTVGVQLAETPASNVYGPMVVKHLQSWRTFDTIVYPYREGDTVDAVMTLTVNGGWDQESGKNTAKGFLIGLSMYTLSPFVGAGTTGRHELVAVLSKDGQEVARYRFLEETKISAGLLANWNEVAPKADQLQTSKLATGLARRLNEDWVKLSKRFE